MKTRALVLVAVIVLLAGCASNPTGMAKTQPDSAPSQLGEINRNMRAGASAANEGTP
jgi:uncharacterized lipoprotein YajG